ncbi:MAG: ATP-binding protein [Anaerolineae bacterium]
MLHLVPVADWHAPYLLPPIQPSAYYLLGAAVAVLIVLTLLRMHRKYLVRRWPSYCIAVLAPLALLAGHLLIVQVWPGQYAWLTAGKSLSVPALLLVAVALGAAYTPMLEAVLLGALASLGTAVWYSHNPLTVLEGAYVAFFMSSLLTQPYRGKLYWWLRQPLVAAPLSVLLALPVALLSAHAVTPGPQLTAIVAAAYLAGGNGVALLAQAVVAGLLLQIVYLTPAGKPVPVPSRVAPHDRSIRARVLATYLPAATISLLLATLVLLRSATQSATSLALAEAARDASSTSQRLARLIEDGQGFLAAVVVDDDLGSRSRRQAYLDESLTLSPSFTALLLVDDAGSVTAASPSSADAPQLSDDERRQLADLAPEAAGLTPVGRPAVGAEATVSLISPAVGDRRLIGRMCPTVSQPWQDVLADLQWTVDAGNGFVVDDQRRVIAHPNGGYVLTMWDPRPQYAHYYVTGTGLAYDAPDAGGARHLVYSLPVAGYPWQIVIEVPQEVVLELALDLSLPMLAVLAAVALLGTLIVWLGAWRMSRPLVRLATTAGEIAAGDFSMTADVGGHDEVGHLGRSFEEMRLSLHRRLSDMGLLLNVVRSVSASHDWSFQPILRAAVTGTQAISACICLNDEGGGRVPAAHEGDFAGWSEILPQVHHLAREAQQKQHALPIRSLVRYLREESPKAVAADVRAGICLPLTSAQGSVGVMWVLYPDRRQFDEQDIDLLGALANQAAVVYENARLLTEAQTGRGRLRAILASTSDPIIVADQQGRLILSNPAAERMFGLQAHPPGISLSAIVPDASMRVLLETPLETSSLTREIHLEDGTTLYASVSPVALTDGGNVGRVVVMRDITELKRRENAQADFVAMLSRHLRTPLTFMRGYASMVPRVGALNQQQDEFVERIVRHVDEVSGMLDSLVDLNSIEMGEGARLERCSVAAAIEAALASVRPEVEKRQHNLRLSLPQAPLFVDADRTLLPRAIAALIDNAAKYMADGGTIGIQVRRQEGGSAIVVSDSGIGIEPSDQMRVFDRFYRADRQEVQSVPGYGLGLASVKAIAAWHGGRVWLDSEPGVGSRFYLWLPRHS